MWCFLNCLLWTYHTFFPVIKSRWNYPCAWLFIGICFVILYFTWKRVSEKDNIFYIYMFVECIWGNQKQIPEALIALFHSMTFEYFFLILWHVSKKVHKSVIWFSESSSPWVNQFWIYFHNVLTADKCYSMSD